MCVNQLAVNFLTSFEAMSSGGFFASRKKPLCSVARHLAVNQSRHGGTCAETSIMFPNQPFVIALLCPGLLCFKLNHATMAYRKVAYSRASQRKKKKIHE